MTERIRDTEALLYELIGVELSEVKNLLLPGPGNPFLIELPDPSTVDLSLEDVSSLVVKTSNAFGRAARLSGIAQAEAKLAKARFDRMWKRSRKGANEREADAVAMEICYDLHIALSASEAVVELADKLEAAARIASESARKIHTSVVSQLNASSREDKGF